MFATQLVLPMWIIILVQCGKIIILWNCLLTVKTSCTSTRIDRYRTFLTVFLQHIRYYQGVLMLVVLVIQYSLFVFSFIELVKTIILIISYCQVMVGTLPPSTGRKTYLLSLQPFCAVAFRHIAHGSSC